jgi:hypothetical protein
MRRTLTSFALGACLMTVSSPRGIAQTAPALKVYTAIEIEYPTEIGKSYQLEGAANLTHWTAIGNPVLGHGRVVDQTFSTKNAGAISFAAYRLQVTAGPANGFAPWSLAGARVQMDDSSPSNFVEFVTADHGQDNYAGALDPFTYQFTRLSENNASVDRTFTPDRRELITYSYVAPGVGTWVRRQHKNSRLDRTTSGTFTVAPTGQ